jgi:hypothetical protein
VLGLTNVLCRIFHNISFSGREDGPERSDGVPLGVLCVRARVRLSRGGRRSEPSEPSAKGRFRRCLDVLFCIIGFCILSSSDN